ncbi:dnaJ homolog subfamily C member 2 [Homalodisca vitripennis]|uniref:dnaJ homolog subfamily C member 2 n=1 Tax=Homalodisca vitripennis TaxID=197043 RepID=UPI001EEA978C|nr:dnaJ homolog subfamily C member 2 [Homalodisca vitripennis]KAG8262047.1 DnaJ (Hsp40), sub C, member 2 [Homalodisca vitripennis]
MGENKEPVTPGDPTADMVDEKQESQPEERQLAVNLRHVECMGPWFLRYIQEKDAEFHHCEVEEVEAEECVIENDDTYLKSLDPKLWKNQDHYAVLGLQKYRHRAPDALIRKAYKQKVLQHHPDKRCSTGKIDINNDYFTCITKAWEILGTKEKRRAFDSVDPEFDNTIPYDNENVRKNFYDVFGDIFERNARWSEKKMVPKLGGPDATKQEVDNFYNFWYSFESWREFSYWDSEAKESGQDRDERKWIEKQNKADRAKKKKDEMSRIRRLVDLAYGMDPRIVQFKIEEKERKLAAKKAKQEAAREKAEELKRVEREAEERVRLEKEKEEAEERAKADALKAERDAEKRIIKKERKKIRDICKANQHFISNENDLVNHMTVLEKALTIYGKTELIELTKSLETKGKKGFMEMMAAIEQLSEKERRKDEGLINKQNSAQSNDPKGGSTVWSKEDVQILIRAVNLFPAGTVQRWEAVTNFINQHNNGLPEPRIIRNKKEVLAKVKELQNTSSDLLKETINKNAYDSFEKEKKASLNVTSEASERVENNVSAAPWTSEEQKLLEQALKTYPSRTLERWDKVAECVKSRSKKECMLRCKELAEIVKAKKAAQASKTGGSC